MYWPVRKLEKIVEIEEFVMTECGYKESWDLTYFEKENLALEGRGTLLIDWKDRCLYATISNRTHEPVVKELAKRMSEKSGKTYTYYMIDAYDPESESIPFHTSCYFYIHKEDVIVDFSNFR